ncbi:MAG: hypothetical protein PHN69_05155 [Candidatus Pacebacteria bacterium]|nr:hypothetical protein [Candidatus Paceibacterota bacterium]
MGRIPLEKHQLVQILDGSEWHGLYGVVEDIICEIPIIFCIKRAWDRYWVYPELKDKIRVIG